MGKVAAFLLLSVLSGSSPQVHVVVSPDSTSITVPKAIVDQHENSPLTRFQWLMRKALFSVPVFETGANIDRVRDELIERNLSILREWPGYLVVREGVPLIDLSGPVREKYIYGFNSDGLILGPLRFAQAQRSFVSAGLTRQHIETLKLFVGADPADPSPYNEFAWLLATYPDPSLRDAQLAIELASYAVGLDDLDEWAYVDTLAASHAAAGDFASAVMYQRRAIALQHEADDGTTARLALYLNNESLVLPLAKFGVVENAVDDPEPTPKAETLKRAAAGSVDAQWSLASFYIGNDIRQSEGIVSPGAFWLEQAAANGHAYAANELGYCYLMALCGLDQDYPAAVQWFSVAAEVGDATAAFNLGRMLAIGQGAPINDLDATHWLTVAADAGINAAAFHVAFRYGEGLGAPPNYRASRKYLERAENAGYTAADYLLDDAFFQRFHGGAAIAAMLDRNAIRPTEMADALMVVVRIVEEAMDTEDETFVVRFVDDTSVEYPTTYGPSLIFVLTRIAASLGSPDAQRKLASFYERGKIVSRAMIEAHYWRQRATQ